MEEEDFGNCGGREALDRTDSDPLEDPCQYQRGEIRRQSTPDRGQDEDYDAKQVDWAFPEENSRGGDYYATKPQTRHIETGRQGDFLHIHIVVCDIG